MTTSQASRDKTQVKTTVTRISQDHLKLKSHTHRHPQTERQARPKRWQIQPQRAKQPNGPSVSARY